eukprot:s3031_g10.t1
MRVWKHLQKDHGAAICGRVFRRWCLHAHLCAVFWNDCEPVDVCMSAGGYILPWMSGRLQSTHLPTASLRCA